MAKFRNATKLSVAGLIVLGLLAAALSAAALLQHRSGATQPAAPPPTQAPATPQESPDPVGDTIAPEDPESTSTPDGAPGSETESPTPTQNGPRVVVIGDTYSTAAASGIWLDEVSAALEWGEVVNLSAAGRGFLATPRQCELEVCANFGGSIGLIVDEDPDIVITFGGTADGDTPLADPTTSYFQALREALPDADLVAISPVTTDSPAPYYLSMHNTSISDAVTDVDGIFINVGQPGTGDGETLSEAAHSEIADAVIEDMSGV